MKINTAQLEFLLKEIKEIEKEHPNANVVYNLDDREIQIIYPLPEDFNKINPH